MKALQDTPANPPAIAKFALLLLCVLALLAALGAEAVAGPNEDILAASKAGNTAGVEAALAQGASINAVDEKGLSPLELPGLTPLALTAAYGHRNVAEFLLNHGANLDIRSRGLEQTPLHSAAEHGNTNVAELLLDRGADVDPRDVVGATPLAWAALRGHKTTVTLLLTRGALVNAMSSSGKTALHLAATAGNKEVVVLLLSQGADQNIKNTDGQTPLQEMQSSSLDPASKTSIATVLHSPAKKVRTQAIQLPRGDAQAPRSLNPSGGGGSSSAAMPSCWDVFGIARWVIQADPGIKPEVLAGVVDRFQVTMGCRQAPQKTRCSWIGDTWTCTTQ
jgi:ankyrin repeat protein